MLTYWLGVKVTSILIESKKYPRVEKKKLKNTRTRTHINMYIYIYIYIYYRGILTETILLSFALT